MYFKKTRLPPAEESNSSDDSEYRSKFWDGGVVLPYGQVVSSIVLYSFICSLKALRLRAGLGWVRSIVYWLVYNRAARPDPLKRMWGMNQGVRNRNQQKKEIKKKKEQYHPSIISPIMIQSTFPASYGHHHFLILYHIFSLIFIRSDIPIRINQFHSESPRIIRNSEKSSILLDFLV